MRERRRWTWAAVTLVMMLLVAVGCSDTVSTDTSQNNEDSGTSGDSDGPLGSDENPAFVDTSEFSRACQTGDDCTLVAGRACLQCNSSCSWDTAINKKALPDYEAAKEAIACEAESSMNCNNDCGPMPPFCLEGTCGRFDNDVDTDRFPRSCTSDDDCIAIADYTPDQCWSDSCPTWAVNRSEWETMFGIDCSEQPQEDPPDPTQCSGPTVPTCDNGTCVLVQ